MRNKEQSNGKKKGADLGNLAKCSLSLVQTPRGVNILQISCLGLWDTPSLWTCLIAHWLKRYPSSQEFPLFRTQSVANYSAEEKKGVAWSMILNKWQFPASQTSCWFADEFLISSRGFLDEIPSKGKIYKAFIWPLKTLEISNPSWHKSKMNLWACRDGWVIKRTCCPSRRPGLHSQYPHDSQ